MIKKFAAFGLGLTVLSSCSAPQTSAITSPPVNPVYNSAGKSLTPNKLIKNEIRTFKNGSGGRTELVGVPCKISTSLYTIDVVTPAFANVPSFADKTPDATFTCVYNDETKSRVQKPINLTELEKTQGSEFFGVIGVVVAAAVADAAIKDEDSVFTYSLFVMNFRD